MITNIGIPLLSEGIFIYRHGALQYRASTLIQ